MGVRVVRTLLRTAPRGISVFRRATVPAIDRDMAYAAGSIGTFGGHTWMAVQDTARGHVPQGVGDGSTSDRQLLLDEVSGFADEAGTTGGGLAGALYTVTSTDDTASTAETPAAGTFRYGAEGYGLADPDDPRWIVFDPSLDGQTIERNHDVKMRANKTIDGRGVNVTIGGSFDLVIRSLTLPGAAGTVNWEGGVANIVIAYVTVAHPTLAANHDQDLIACDRGFDKVFIHHVTFTGGGDGQLDFTNVSDTRIPGGDRLGRVTVDWCHFGPHPDAVAWANAVANGEVGVDNAADNGKVALTGLDSQDGAWPDALRVTFSRCLFKRGRQRQPKIQRSRVHMYNCMVDEWALPPTLGGFSIATEVSKDGELLSDNCVYRATEPGTTHWLDALETIDDPDTIGVKVDARGTAAYPDPYVKVNSPYLPNGATIQTHNDTKVFRGYSKANLSSPYGTTTEHYNADTDWEGVPPYDYTPRDADDDLIADLEAGAGNVQPWELVA